MWGEDGPKEGKRVRFGRRAWIVPGRPVPSYVRDELNRLAADLDFVWSGAAEAFVTVIARFHTARFVVVPVATPV